MDSDAARPLQQHPAFAAAVRRLGGRAEFVAGTLILQRRLAGLPLTLASRWRGPDPPPARLVNADDPGDAAGLRRAGFRQVATAAHVAELDLAPAPAALRAGLHGKWRNRLLRAERDAGPVTSRRFCPDRDGWFLAAEARQRRRLGYRALPPALLSALSQEEPGAVTLHALPGAAIAMIHLGARVTYHAAWSDPDAAPAEAHRALLWHALLHHRAAGARIADLGTLETETAPGLARFKAGTGARIRPLGGTWLRLCPRRG